MKNAAWKIALQTMIPVLCGILALNALLVSRSLTLIEQNARERAEATQMQALIRNVVIDLQDMETGQRGYLLTGDRSYLAPYEQADGRLAAHVATLRSRLAGKAAGDRLLETELETAAEATIAEMKESIRLRELGYRHRAFSIVSSNRGKEMMEEARAKLDSLSAAQTSNVARYDTAMNDSIRRTARESAIATFILLALAIATFFAFNRRTKRLEVACQRQAQELRNTREQLQRLTSTVLKDVRGLVGQIRDCAEALLDVYGGFLPYQAQQKAETIENDAGEIIRVFDSVFDNLPPGSSTTDMRPSPRLSA